MQDSRPIGATYARVSDPDDTRTASLETQEEASVAKLEAAGFRVLAEHRFREQYTGMESIYDRPILNRIRDLVDQGVVKGLGCYDTDRLALDPKELITVVGANKKAGCETLFVKIDHVLEGRIGEAMLYMKGLASALEWDAIKDRTMRGRLKLFQKGLWVGGGPVRFGYIWDEATRRRIADPETAPIVVRIFELAAEGWSAVEITRWLNDEGVPTPSMRRKQNYKDGRGTKWSHSTITLMIRDTIYIGEPVARRTMPDPEGRKRPNGRPLMVPRPAGQQLALPGETVEPLVSRELFAKANEMIQAHRTNYKQANRMDNGESLLAGYIWCLACGCRMTPVRHVAGKRISRNGKDHGERSRCYRCTGNAKSRVASRTDCSATVGAKWADKLVWETVLAMVSRPDFLKREFAKAKKDKTEDRIQADLAAAEKQRSQHERKLKNLIEGFGAADSKVVRDAVKSQIDECDRQIKECDQHIRELNARLAPFRSFRLSEARIVEQIGALQAEIARPETMTRQWKRKLFRWLGLRAYVAKGRKVEIHVDIRLAPVAGANHEISGGGMNTPAGR